MSNRPDAPDRDARLNRVIVAFLEAAESGCTPDRGALLAEHPEFDQQLREYFAAHDEFSTLVAEFTPAPQPRDRLPRRFGPYEIVAEIGRGGMGVVYRARQAMPDRFVALKMIRPALWATTVDVQRFRSEGESAARLDHPNIVPIYQIGESDGQLFFSMKLCSGGSLAGLAGDGRPMSDPRRAVEFVAAIARAIHHAHQRGILHRDLKPSNILLDEAGRPYVADFGLAKVLDAEGDLTATGAVLGTPGYLAPELIPAFTLRDDGSRPVPTTAVDVYGLGAILYFLLTGRAPFRGATLAETLALVQARDPASPRHVNPAIDRDLAAVCLRCLEKAPAQRYSSAEALAEDLERWLAGKPTRARPVGHLGRARRWVQRNPIYALLAMLVVLSAGGGLAALGLSYQAVLAEREASRKSQRETALFAENLRTRVYADDMGRAHAHWQRGETSACRDTLDRYLPRDGETDLRGWEWHYLHALLLASPREAARFQSVNRPADVTARHAIAYQAVFSPDGQVVASAWESGQIRLWEPWTGQAPEPINAHFPGDANWLVFIDGGRQLVSAGEDGTIKVWDVRSHKRVGEPMRGHRGPVESIAVTPDGQRLISGGADGILRVWDLPAHKILHELPGHTHNIEGVALSPDGRFAASAGFDGNVIVWDLSGPEPRQKWIANAASTLYAVCFSPDGGRVAVARADNSLLEYESATGRRLGQNSKEVGKYRGVAYVPGADGMLLAVGDDGRLRAWDSDRDEFLWTTPAHSLTAWSVSCSPDGRFAVTAGSDGSVRVWSLKPPPVRPLDSSRGSVSYLFGDQIRLLVQTTTTSEWGEGERAWTFRLDGVAGTTTASGAFEPASAVSPDQRVIAHARTDGAIVLHDRISGSDRSLLALPDPPPKFGWPRGGTIRMMRFLDDVRLAVLYSDGTLGIVPLTGGAPVFRDRMTDEGHVGLEVISRTRLVVATQSRLRIFDLERNDWLPAEYRAPSRIESLAVTPDGARATVGLSTGGIKVIALPEAREELNLFGHEASVVAVAYSPDGKTIASACSDGIVRLWHAATGQELFVVERRRGITSLAFTADGRLLVAGKAFQDGRTITVHDPGKPPN